MTGKYPRIAWFAIIGLLLGIAVEAPSAFAALAKKQERGQAIPAPVRIESRSKPSKVAKTALVEFQSAPFPYHGTPPNSQTPFLNVNSNGRMGHQTPYGHVFWEDETYNDRHVLLHIPKGFDTRRPAIMIVFFHGHGAILERDVLVRQQLAAQVSASGMNAVLVAPQLAVDAADSSAGKFWEPGAFARFIGEAGQALGKLHGDAHSARTFASMPVILVAYSGGFEAAAWCATRGGLKNRVRGVVLMDALYGELDKFVSWIESDKTAFFVSAFLDSTREKNAQLENVLTARNIAFSTALDPRLGRGDITFIPGGSDARHRDLLTHAWIDYPVSDLLRRLPEYTRK